MVARDIPALELAMLTPGKMRQRAVHRIVRQHELRLRQRQMLDEGRIVVKVSCVGAGSAQAAILYGLEFQMHHQGAEKRFFQDQARARGGKLGLDLRRIGNHRLSRQCGHFTFRTASSQ